jgi:hypothetical protein
VDVTAEVLAALAGPIVPAAAVIEAVDAARSPPARFAAGPHAAGPVAEARARAGR